ncbi:MAG: metallophosphoesterase [Smithella sp.]
MDTKKIKIGVISDTHLPGYDERLSKIVLQHFSGVDFIIHAGDLVNLRVLDMFDEKEVKAVCGNMDYPSVKEQLPEQLFFEIKGLKFGVIHGWGSPFGIEERILARIGKLDCIVYGHTHNPACHKKDGVFFFNPGSPTDKRFASHRTIGILEIDKEITGRIINL